MLQRINMWSPFTIGLKTSVHKCFPAHSHVYSFSKTTEARMKIDPKLFNDLLNLYPSHGSS